MKDMISSGQTEKRKLFGNETKALSWVFTLWQVGRAFGSLFGSMKAKTSQRERLFVQIFQKCARLSEEKQISKSH